MNTNLRLLASFLLWWPTAHPADAPVAPEPSPTQQPVPTRWATPVRSPEIAPDGRVTFRLRAPKAGEVLLSGQWAARRTALTKDAAGIWSATVGPIAAGIYEYSFLVDGLAMIDPANPAVKPMREPRSSILHLPGQPPLVWDFQQVPHGVVHLHSYWSKVLGRRRELVVYTPPSYETEPGVRFPVLYLQHGHGDTSATWTTHGKAHWILDNLIAEGRARPMLLVMADGHATSLAEEPASADRNSRRFEEDLLEAVVPFVEAHYRVRTEAAGRALAGLSMGGEEALRIGLNHLDRFAWVAGFSAAVPAPEGVAVPLADAAGTNARLKLLWLGCGKDDFLLRRNEEFVALLERSHIRHEWHLSAGTHSWPVWRNDLAELAPRLFQ